MLCIVGEGKGAWFASIGLAYLTLPKPAGHQRNLRPSQANSTMLRHNQFEAEVSVPL